MPAGNPRGMYSIRLAPEAMAEVERLAKDEERTRSDMLRKLLSEALAARAAAAKRSQ